MRVRHSAKTDVGLMREHNEDFYGIGPSDRSATCGHMLVVCDGMGGHAAGEIASRMAVEIIIDRYYASDDPDRAQVLEASFVLANQQVYQQGHGSMGTTGVAALLFEDALYIANVGDSRAYLLRDGQIRQLTQDHSFVAEQVAAGLLTPEQARHSTHRNVITRALGYQPEVAVDLTRWAVRPGDLVLLSSDGLHGLVEDAEILSAATTSSLDQLAERLVALANFSGGSDNITVIAVRIDALDHEPAADPQQGVVTTPLDHSDAGRLAAPPAATSASVSPQHTAELPLRLWGALLAGITALTLIGFALWMVGDPALDPALRPTATLAVLGSPSPQPSAPPAPAATALPPTPRPLSTPAATPTP